MSRCSHVTAPTQFAAAGTIRSEVGRIRSEVLRRAVERALRAPSLANTQPWRWRIGEDSVELHADWDRQLTSTDPDRRDLIISCGAALHHLRVALAALGWSSSVRRLPDPESAAHLATVYPGQERADWQDAELTSAIERRRTDRRHLSARPVPPAALQALAGQAARLGATCT
jgi:nitroreductase